MGKFKLFIQALKFRASRSKGLLSPLYLKWLVGAVLVVTAYIFSRSQTVTVVETFSHQVPEFEKGQILEKQSIEFYREKDRVFRKETRELKKESQELEKRIKELEELIVSKKSETKKVTIVKEASGKSKPVDLKDLEWGTDDEAKGIAVRAKSLVAPYMASNQTPAPRKPKQKRKQKPLFGSDTVSFPVKKTKPKKRLGPILPSGSYAKGVILTGIDAPSGRTLPSLIELDFAYIAPNSFKVDLSGCFLVMKASADISSERVEMQPERISCVGKSGEFFESKTNGFVADGFDNRFAMRGELVEKFGSKLLKATLASALEGAGKAIQMSQTTQKTDLLGNDRSSVTGDVGKYAAGAATSGAASTIAKWYLGQIQKMMPVIRVQSGSVVWIVMTQKVELPRSFFTKAKKEKVDVPKFLGS